MIDPWANSTGVGWCRSEPIDFIRRGKFLDYGQKGNGNRQPDNEANGFFQLCALTEQLNGQDIKQSVTTDPQQLETGCLLQDRKRYPAAGITDVDKLAANLPEIVRDFVEISRADSFELGGSEEDEAAFLEISEFVRMGTLLFRVEFKHFVREQTKTDAEQKH